MTRPKDLTGAGRQLWDAVTSGYDLDPHHLVQLANACRCAMMIERLEVLLADGLIVTGSQGQPRMSSAVTELRQHRLALSKLLADMALPALDTEAPAPEVDAATAARNSANSEKARKAANTRWGRAS